MHDRHGNPLKVGDHVTIVGRITEMQPAEDFCNVTIESVFGRRPDGQRETIHAINTGVLDLAEVNHYIVGKLHETATP